MKNKIVDVLKLTSNKLLKTRFLLSYEQQFLKELHSAVTFVAEVEDAFNLNPAAKFKVNKNEKNS